MKCPKCNEDAKLTHQQWWCSKCFIGFTRPADLDEFISEIALRAHLKPSVRQMIDEKTGMDLLNEAIDYLCMNLYPDPFHIVDSLCIARTKLVNKNGK